MVSTALARILCAVVQTRSSSNRIDCQDIDRQEKVDDASLFRKISKKKILISPEQGLVLRLR